MNFTIGPWASGQGLRPVGWNDESEEGGRRGGRGDRSEARDEFRAVRHRLRAALGDFVDAPADKQAEAIAILEAAAEALEALSHK
ncbi:hypothetical protein [Mesorhizobium sp. M7A.F.Ca.US.014.04.1.1]|uniref:hypothetical protein n=1 Tax=Mesorhizobium sp. M7A.F.Ca.US.014.04.1.1 TaxID=2496744 RepID=UPI001FDF8897|nr:hypothetical protein [Mesorhizobium sp. M7A.F.Ca.US.014.04.1.1]